MSLLAGCGSEQTSKEAEEQSVTTDTESSDKKVMVIGDTTFNGSNEEPDVNPHNTYAGWACIRYGIGETLVKYSDNMEIQP